MDLLHFRQTDKSSVFLTLSIVFIGSFALNEINVVLCQPSMLTLLVVLCIFHVTCEFCAQVSEIWTMRLAGHTGIVLDVSSNAEETTVYVRSGLIRVW